MELDVIKPTVPKTREEKMLSIRYKRLLSETNNYIALLALAKDFKADLALFKKNSTMYKNVVCLILFSTISYSQSYIVASGSENITIGETFPIMQTVFKVESISLGVPTFEVPVVKPIVKKKLSFWQRLINFITNKKQKK